MLRVPITLQLRMALAAPLANAACLQPAACDSSSTAPWWIAHALRFCLPSVFLKQGANAAAPVQGMAVKLRLSNLKAGNHEMLDGITRVLTDGNYTLAAKALSAKIRSHRRTPVQQAGGERPSHHTWCSSEGHEAEAAKFLRPVALSKNVNSHGSASIQ